MSQVFCLWSCLGNPVTGTVLSPGSGISETHFISKVGKTETGVNFLSLLVIPLKIFPYILCNDYVVTRTENSRKSHQQNMLLKKKTPVISQLFYTLSKTKNKEKSFS